jgi:HK97 family phage portal protein
MAWFNRIFGGGALSNTEEGPQLAGPTTYQTESGIVLTDERALGISAVWSCVRLISETVGSLPVGVFERTDSGRQSITDHHLYRLFREAPNDLMTPMAFREAMTMQLCLWGNAYAHIERDSKGVPYSLTPLRADRVTPTLEAGTKTYHYERKKGVHIFAKESIFHLIGFGVEGVVGLSPLDNARNTFGVSASADKYASKAFSSNGRPPGFISIDKVLTDTQRKQLQEMYRQSSVDESTTWVFEAGTKYNPISLPPDALQMLQSRAFQLSEVARIFRVPSFLINDTEKSTSWGTGLEQTNLAFLTYTLRPYLSRWESTIADSLLTKTERRRYFVEHNVEGLLRADSAARAAFYSSGLQNGWTTVNEVRRRENLEPIAGGDEAHVQSNMTLLELLGQMNGNETPAI